MAATQPPNVGILSEDRRPQREKIVEMLTAAYWMELETVQNYLAQSVNLDGIRAQEIKENLAKEVDEELSHAKQFAERIKALYGTVPGSVDFAASQDSLQPAGADRTDVVAVIKGVLDAERGAIEHYNTIIEFSEELDPVTHDMVTEILEDEEGHFRLYEGFLREYEK